MLWHGVQTKPLTMTTIAEIFQKLNYLGYPDLYSAMVAFRSNPHTFDLEGLYSWEIIALDEWYRNEFFNL